MKIVRYGNRKLFVAKLGYISLNAACAAILDDPTTVVLDYNTKNNITNQTLLRGIGEYADKGFALTRGDIVGLASKMQFKGESYV